MTASSPAEGEPLSSGQLRLKLQCKRTSMVSSIDPEPFWSVHDLLSELKHLESQLSAPPTTLYSEEEKAPSKPFVMRLAENLESESDDEDNHPQILMRGTRFSCTDIESSDSDGSDDESQSKAIRELCLALKKSPEGGILFEYELEHQLKVKEELRNSLSTIELDQWNENSRFSSALQQIESHIKERQELNMRLDRLYAQNTAAAVKKHVSLIQRDHELKSGIEEQRIKDDAVFEEARKKEIALQVEKLRQAKAKEEEEARVQAAIVMKEKQQAALEAARAAEEGATKERYKIHETNSVVHAPAEAHFPGGGKLEEKDGSKNMRTVSGIRTYAADSALKAGETKLHFYTETSKALSLVLTSNKSFGRHERQIVKHLKHITGVLHHLRTAAHDLVNIIKDPLWPPPVSMLTLAKKVLLVCESQNSDRFVFACGHVLLLISSQIPSVLDFVVAELHMACIYTVPKHFEPTNPSSKALSYFKMIGYREENGKIESEAKYLARLETCVKLYAALIQTEVKGIRNPYGLREGWAWLARFLNNIPATKSTAYALNAFLQMAGFALWRKYKCQFEKIIFFISGNFLPKLRKRRHEHVELIIKDLETYIEHKSHQKEAEGVRLEHRILSLDLC